MIPSRRLVLLLAVIALGLAPTTGLLAAFGDPRGFLDNVTVTERSLYPGVKLYRADGRESGLRQVTHVVTVDLSIPNLSLKSLTGQRYVGSTQYFRRSFMSQMQADNDALVAINTSFFDIGSTQTPSGLIIQDGVMIREPNSARNLLAFDTDRKLTIPGNLSLVGSIFHNRQSRSFVGMNREALANGQIAVYQQPWNRSPGNNSPFTTGLDITEVVVRKTGFFQSSNKTIQSRLVGQVLSVRNNVGGVSIANDQIVLTAAGSARTILQAMQPGQTVEVRWRFNGGPTNFDWSDATQIVSGSNRLITNGTRNSGNSAHWNDRHPRSAAGVSSDGTQLILLLVEGRQSGRAEGMSLHTIARYLQHMGAYNAVEFDGGGSSGIAARIDGQNQLVNTPSGGGERYVPAGLGIMVDPETPNPMFRDIRITPGVESAVLSWSTSLPATSHVVFGSDNYDRQSTPSPRPSTRHSAILTDLKDPGTTFLRLIAEFPYGSTTSQALEVALGSFDEIVMDDPQATYTGSWLTGEYPTPWGPGYRHAVTVLGTATHTATFRPAISTSGKYDAYVWFVHGTNRPPAAQYRVRHDAGLSSYTLDQTSGGSQWRLLAGNLSFTAGADRYVQILNSSNIAGKHVMVDGLRLVLTEPAPTPAGTPPTWWTKHFFDSETPAPADDNDGDGISLWEEFVWATDPADPASRPEIELQPTGTGDWKLSFAPYHEGRSYSVQGRKSLDDSGWATVILPQPSVDESGRGVFLLPSAIPFQFFRIAAELP